MRTVIHAAAGVSIALLLGGSISLTRAADWGPPPGAPGVATLSVPPAEPGHCATCPVYCLCPGTPDRTTA